MQPPNIPLRLGPSGPPANIPAILADAGLLTVRRVWNVGTGLGNVTIPAETSANDTPNLGGTDIVWTAEDEANGDNIAYLVLATLVAMNVPDPSALPGAIVANIRIKGVADPAPGYNVNNFQMPLIAVASPAGDYDFVARASFSCLVRNAYGPNFSEGVNHIAVDITNLAPGEAIQTVGQASSFTIIELVGPATLVLGPAQWGPP